MRLSKSILSNLEEILTEWESFASTVLPENKLDKLALRDDGEIVEAHLGKISVTSIPQDGTTFVVRLPLRTTEDHAANVR
jgi:hypothetical protein